MRAVIRVLSGAALLLLCAGTAWAFDFEELAERARELAAATYRDIRYKPERALWRDAKLPFELAFFHRGFSYEHAVRINEVTADGVREIRFDPDAFDYGANRFDLPCSLS